MWGISYPGFYTAAALPDAHPALVASSPQAPISDFFFDDFHHNGAFLQSYLFAFPVFGYQKNEKTTNAWYRQFFIKTDNKDGYDFNLKLGALKNVDKYYGNDNFFWQETIDHPNYDEFWQVRNLLPHLKNVNHAVMTVGGLFDAEEFAARDDVEASAFLREQVEHGKVRVRFRRITHETIELGSHRAGEPTEVIEDRAAAVDVERRAVFGGESREMATLLGGA
jgi:predicted acyl esterase